MMSWFRWVIDYRPFGDRKLLTVVAVPFVQTPNYENAYMGMICYCNGALARENVRNDLNRNIKWITIHGKKFNELLDKSKILTKARNLLPIGRDCSQRSCSIQKMSPHPGGSGEKRLRNGLLKMMWPLLLNRGPSAAEWEQAPCWQDSEDGRGKGRGGHAVKKNCTMTLTAQFGDIYTDGETTDILLFNLKTSSNLLCWRGFSQ